MNTHKTAETPNVRNYCWNSNRLVAKEHIFRFVYWNACAYSLHSVGERCVNSPSNNFRLYYCFVEQPEKQQMFCHYVSPLHIHVRALFLSYFFFLLFVAQFTSTLCCIVPAQHIYILQQFLSFVRWLLFLLIRLTVILDGFLFIWAPYECIMIAIMNVCSCCWIMVWEWWNQLLCKCFDIKVDKLVKSLANEDV